MLIHIQTSEIHPLIDRCRHMQCPDTCVQHTHTDIPTKGYCVAFSLFVAAFDIINVTGHRDLLLLSVSTSSISDFSPDRRDNASSRARFFVSRPPHPPPSWKPPPEHDPSSPSNLPKSSEYPSGCAPNAPTVHSVCVCQYTCMYVRTLRKYCIIQ